MIGFVIGEVQRWLVGLCERWPRPAQVIRASEATRSMPDAEYVPRVGRLSLTINQSWEADA